MTLEKQVTSLELSKKLKELGVKQESLFYWITPASGAENYRLRFIEEIGKYVARVADGYSAFTVAELGSLLPDIVDGKLLTLCKNQYIDEVTRDYYDHYSYYYQKYGDENAPSFTTRDKSEADARAKLLIYLLENKLI